MNRIFLLILCCCLICLSGCGGEKAPSGFPKVYPMTVTVTDGTTPLPDVQLMFYLVGGTGATGSSGSTNASGVAKISTFQATYSKVGVPAGEYVVTVEDIIRISSSVPPEEKIKMSLAELGKLEEERKKKLAEFVKKVPEVLCKQGKVADRSPIRFTATEGKNELKIDIAEYKK